MGGQRACCQAVNSSGACYRDVLLSQYLLPAIKEMSADCFTFQQDSSPAHQARTADKRDARLHSFNPLATQQSGSQSCGLQDLECATRASLQESDQIRESFEREAAGGMESL